MKTLKRYWLTASMVVFVLAAFAWRPDLGVTISQRSARNFLEMFGVLPPIFILLGLLEAWVPKEVIMKNLGDTSGLRGIALSILLGAAAAGPLYVAFPVAVAMLKKGARFANIAVFLFSWSTLKIPLLLFEASALGWRITIIRGTVNLVAIIIMGLLVDRLIAPAEKETLRQRQMAVDAKAMRDNGFPDRVHIIGLDSKG